ncbi:DUF1667 domain-containing protein [Brachyspira hyodysenteriae]|nr:DUF1667 domain-containing protein [Brachyspira hyodysenteriae]MDA1469034.1 DUF1667 domain-containing protein [Brachyspira hyodysenteriae]
MEKKELTCICCPMGCALSVELEGSNVLSVSGNTCKRGDTYARDEVVRPVRMVTSIVRVKNGKLKMLPVKTKEPIDKSKIPECLEALKHRLYNCIPSDHIYFLKDGIIMEEGTHDKLMNLNGEYAKIYNEQSNLESITKGESLSIAI